MSAWNTEITVELSLGWCSSGDNRASRFVNQGKCLVSGHPTLPRAPPTVPSRQRMLKPPDLPLPEIPKSKPVDEDKYLSPYLSATKPNTYGRDPTEPRRYIVHVDVNVYLWKKYSMNKHSMNKLYI